MALQTLAGHDAAVGENSDDLCLWLRRLQDCPRVDQTVLLSCANPAHGGDSATWFYVEADVGQGLARRRCVACASEHTLLHSGEEWTFPQMHACLGCGQSMVELAAGLHLEQAEDRDFVTWVVVGCRCVACGQVAGLTDIRPIPVAPEHILAAL
jgi:hypothetical protein